MDDELTAREVGAEDSAYWDDLYALDPAEDDEP